MIDEWKWEIGEKFSGSVVEAASLIGEVANGSRDVWGEEQAAQVIRIRAWLAWRVSDGWDVGRSSSPQGWQFDASVRALAVAALSYFDSRRKLVGFGEADDDEGSRVFLDDETLDVICGRGDDR